MASGNKSAGKADQLTYQAIRGRSSSSSSRISFFKSSSLVSDIAWVFKLSLKPLHSCSEMSCSASGHSLWALGKHFANLKLNAVATRNSNDRKNEHQGYRIIYGLHPRQVEDLELLPQCSRKKRAKMLTHWYTRPKGSLHHCGSASIRELNHFNPRWCIRLESTRLKKHAS